MDRFLIGVDEAGRGPLAGPVAVGVVMARERLDVSKCFPGVKDSKQLSEREREELYARLIEYEQRGFVRHVVLFSSASMIDRVGITRAVRRAVYRGVRLLAPESAGVTVLLDGLLHAPKEYAQETIIRGDQTEPLISLASIAAKVRRDRLMKRMGKRFPEYGFEIHKGYGTKGHREALRTFGPCAIHRTSFCARTVLAVG